jgi:putative DNA primase/helicase
MAVLPVWILHTYVYDEFEFTPYLNIISPEHGCGKTTVGDVLSALGHRATSPMSGSAAVLRRKIASERPTLILDEWDSLEPSMRRACQNLLNTGFRQDGSYSMVDKGRVVNLSTFCPKAIIGRAIVQLPQATQSRCISIRIERALPNEPVEKFRASHRAQATELREHCERWAKSFKRRQVRVEPLFPPALSARQQDISEPLLAIADDGGLQWPHLVREALVALFDERQLPTPENELLRAVRRFLQTRSSDHFPSQEFCDWANAQEERPWSEKPLTPAKLALMLRTYGIHPVQINRVIGGKQVNIRGYKVVDFEDAFVRYTAKSP